MAVRRGYITAGRNLAALFKIFIFIFFKKMDNLDPRIPSVSDGQATPTEEVLGSNDKQEAVEAARPKRKTEPNRMLSGPEWSK